MSSTANPAAGILRKTIIYTAVVAVVIGVLGGLVGYAVAGMDGLLSALVGTALAVIFAVITAISIMFAIRKPLTVFFGIVLGSWLLKIIVFIALLAFVTSLDFVHPMILFLSMVAAIVGTLAVDVIVVLTARQSYVDPSVLPGDTPETGPSTR
ncbi:MAG: hypothetical protein IR160_02500 [Salinibacterium sp.]|nr:hypothetical protein [Salinibacterium sp.]MBF0671438.1 hypothetical protein [Salinibacterium sp.]